METDNAGAVQAIYNYGNDLISMNRAGVNSYYNYDGLGSVKQMTDSSGVVTVIYTYDAFGNKIAETGSSSNVYGFTGEQQFGEADNLVFLRARYYKPSIGRFISRDPIGYYAGLNLYSYIWNNPINGTDPSGMTGLSCAPCIGCITGTTAYCYIVCTPETGDCPDLDCMNSCFRHILLSIDRTDIRVWIVRIGCWAACAACALI